jgi:hypothetical protein
VFVARGVPTLKYGKRIDDFSSCRPIYDSCDIDFSKGSLLDTQVIENIIVNIGKDKVVQSLTNGYMHPIMRMCIGDRGTLPSDPTVPKVVTATMTRLFNEVYRADIEAVVQNVGTPDAHEVKFIKTFSSVLVPVTAFSNSAKPVINEVGLITADLNMGAFPRDPVYPPYEPGQPPADEKLFSIRTFKTVPFEAANEISVTIRYTIFVE